MKTNFFNALDDKFRGTREIIRERLNVYLPFLKLYSLYNTEQKIAIDLGCGRGEWLEILSDLGITAYGVELNNEKINFCKLLGLDVRHEDAISHISRLDSCSVDIITAFHLVEHISFTDVVKLIDEVHRVLKPGGLLIIETPNPENILVGTCSFYMDPTHIKPLPKELLNFIALHSGFNNSKIISLSGKKLSDLDSNIGITDIIFSVGLEYAILSQKLGDINFMNEIDVLLNNESSIGLHRISRFYDDMISHKFNSTSESSKNIELKLNQLLEYLVSDNGFLSILYNNISDKNGVLNSHNLELNMKIFEDFKNSINNIKLIN